MNKIFSFVRTAGNVLLYSLRTATFCRVAVGLVVAILVIRGIIRKNKCKKQDDNYGMEGMSLGMCLGLLIGTMFEVYIGISRIHARALELLHAHTKEMEEKYGGQNE